MQWMDLVARDPVPWLLDPGNPSTRYLTLRDIFLRPASFLVSEQQRILDWHIIRELRRHWKEFNFWGRADNPYYGGLMGNFGTLYLLTQLGAPRFDEVEPTCENLIARGRLEDGSFAPWGVGSAPRISYTGIALQILNHFGYGDDPQVRSSWEAMLHIIRIDPEHLGCPLDDQTCRAGAVKALGALLSRSLALRTSEDNEAIDALCHYLLDRTYSWKTGEDDWVRPRFPRYYDADLVEFCHVLAHTHYQDHPTFREGLRVMVELQNEIGRWPKMKGTPVLQEERIHRPCRWLTYEAVHALALTFGDDTYAP